MEGYILYDQVEIELRLKHQGQTYKVTHVLRFPTDEEWIRYKAEQVGFAGQVMRGQQGRMGIDDIDLNMAQVPDAAKKMAESVLEFWRLLLVDIKGYLKADGKTPVTIKDVKKGETGIPFTHIDRVVGKFLKELEVEEAEGKN